MKPRTVLPSVLIIFSILGTVIGLFEPMSRNFAIPDAHAAPPNNPAILGLFSETKKSNSIVDSTISPGATFTMDVNLTDAGPLVAFDINITMTSASIVYAGSSFSGAGCPASDRVISPNGPPSGQTLKTDPLIKFVANTPASGTGWAPDSRDSVIYDANNNNRYDPGEAIIFGITPATGTILNSDSAIKYVDLTPFDNVWNPGEPVVLDPNNDNVYDTTPRCLFDRIAVSEFANSTAAISSNLNAYRLSVLDSDIHFPFVSGTGILFRVTFRTNFMAPGVASVIHIDTKTSTILNPSSLPYNQVDGYFDSRASPSNYAISTSLASMTVIRKVSGTNSTTATVTIGTVTNVGTITLNALGLPVGTVASFSPPTCNAACTSTLTITVNGGPKGAAGTTPTGSYFVPIIGSSTATGVLGSLIRSTWVLLIVKPPKAPVFTVTVTPKSFTQEAGNYTVLNVFVALTDSTTANDSIVLGQNCPNGLQGISCVFQPGGGSFPLTAALKVSTNPLSTTPGVYEFTATVTTQGTYSEIVITQSVTLTMTVIKTHDLAVQGVSLATRNFAYNGVSLSCPSLCPASPVAGSTLKTDAKIKYVDVNNNNVWDSGEPVVYDNNTNGLFDGGEPVIAGSTITVGQALKTDPLIKYQDINGNNVWDVGEFVVKDSSNDNVYQAGEPAIGGLGQLQISVTVSNLGTVSERFLVNSTARVVLNNNDCRLNFVDANNNHNYDLGEVVVLDSDCNRRYGSGSTDSRIAFVNATNTDVWAPGKTVVIDADQSGTYTAPDIVICAGVPGVCGGAAPANGTKLKFDAKLLFVDANRDSQWDPGETVFYDTNGNWVYDPGETLILGSAPPAEIVQFGTTPPLGTLLSDQHLSYVDSNMNSVWDPGESIVWDSNSNGLYDAGEPVPVPGLNPPSGAVLLASQTATSAVGATVVVTLGWNPGSLPRGQYLIGGAAVLAASGCPADPCEFNTGNNALLIIGFTSKLRGDVNGDCKVNINDVLAVQGRFQVSAGQPSYLNSADFNNDGTINIIDVIVVNGVFGTGC